jgi:SAM-dependent methyltransferase
MTAECNICGGAEFAPAPNNRLSRRGLPPVCAKCGSLERHRIGRKVLTAVRDSERFLKLDLLQLSRDPAVAKDWFASVETSQYGGENSIDIQDIDRPDGRYGFIVCSHILEHVPDPRRALQELARVLNPEGLLYLAYPYPIAREITKDWGFPEPTQHGHYRVFGRDFEAEFGPLLPDAYTIAIQERDDVTGDYDLQYLIAKDEFWKERVLSAVPASRLISTPTRHGHPT